MSAKVLTKLSRPWDPATSSQVKVYPWNQTKPVFALNPHQCRGGRRLDRQS